MNDYYLLHDYIFVLSFPGGADRARQPAAAATTVNVARL